MVVVGEQDWSSVLGSRTIWKTEQRTRVATMAKARSFIWYISLIITDTYHEDFNVQLLLSKPSSHSSYWYFFGIL